MHGWLSNRAPDHRWGLLNTHNLQLERCGFSSNPYQNHIVVSGVQATEHSSCLELKSGKILWQFDNKGHSATPIVAHDKVFQNTEKNFRCLDLKSGQLLWEIEGMDYFFNPEIVDNTIVAIGSTGAVNLYQSKSGKLLHQLKIPNEGSVRSITSNDDTLYFGDSNGTFYCYTLHRKKIDFWSIKNNCRKTMGI